MGTKCMRCSANPPQKVPVVWVISLVYLTSLSAIKARVALTGAAPLNRAMNIIR